MKKHPLLQLLADNRQLARQLAQGNPLKVRQLANDEAEIRIYAPIVDDAMEAEYWGGVAPEPFLEQLNAITAATIHVRINSPGGSVFGARAMETGLREHKARIVMHIDSLAASAASFLAMAGDEIVMSNKGAMIMIHKAWTIAWGNADDLLATAGLLEKIDGTLVETYADRSKQEPKAIADWMAAETWFTAAEAVAAGLADNIAEPKGGTADDGEQARARWNLTAYTRAPKLEAPPPPPAPSPSPAAARADAAALLRRLAVATLPA